MASPTILSTRPPNSAMSATSRSNQPSTRFLTCSGSSGSASVVKPDDVGEQDRHDASLVTDDRELRPQVEQKRAALSLTEPQDGQVILRSIRVAHGDPSYVLARAERTRDDRAERTSLGSGGLPLLPPRSHPMSAMPASAPGTAAARAVDAVKYYGYGDTAVAALDGVTVDFAHGQLTAIMGPSGSGKSTLMHCMAGLDTLTSGQVFVGDVDLRTLDDKELTLLRRDRLGLHLPGLQPHPDAHRAREHHPARRPRRARPRPGVARPRGRDRRPRRPPHPPAERALRRPAAARRGGAGARPAARDHLRRRAHRQPRLAGQQRDPRVHADRGARISARPS